MDFYFILRAISIILSLSAFFIGLGFIRNTEGKFRKTLIYSIIAIFILAVLNLTAIIEIFTDFNGNLIRAFGNILITFSLLWGVLNVKAMIKDLIK